ncbi:MAG: DNA polymerase III subunit gamma/tau [Gammaproteobacteria bacterium]|nr:DNA polymerase III subunit gamma/tau [Gammaproteobacteria bacterium]
MTYHVLARKWRPQTFSDLVGQSHVVKALTYALSHDQVHHAYLFTGTRGVGKTSIARIFAKSLNCETNGVSANPCGECESCIEIKSGKFVDLIEVDAASRTGVEETRELIDSIAYLPTKGRYKVYLIDEVHMFSKSSFNALLKTLEEPPEYVKFILATTDPDKLPITILSRCLQFNLKSLTQPQIRQHLANICEAESIRYDNEALALLAGAGDGSMRDTLSMTDQAIAYGQGELHTAAVTEILGTIHPADIEAILFAIATNNPNQLSTALHRLDNYEVDARAFLIEIMQRLQRMAWAKEGIVEGLSQALLSTVNDVPKPLLHLWYDIAEKALPNLSVAGEPRHAVEMTLLRMLAFIPNDWVPRHRTVLDESLVSPSSPDVTSNTSILGDSAGKQQNNTKATDDLPQRGGSGASDENSNALPSSSDGFAEHVHAQPITHADDLAAAEAQFSNAVSVGTDQSPNVANESKPLVVDESVSQQHLVSSQSTESEVPTPTLTESVPEQSAQSKADWNLAEEESNGPIPSMDEINAMMQRASEISAPVELEADAHSIMQSNDCMTAQSASEVTAESECSESPQSQSINDIPPWESSELPSEKEIVDEPISAENSPIVTVEANNVAHEEVVVEEINSAAKNEVASLPPRCEEKPQQATMSVDDFQWIRAITELELSDYTLHFVSLGILRLEPADGYVDAILDLPPTNAVMETPESLAELQTKLEAYIQQPVKASVNLTAVHEQTPAEVFQKQQVQKQNDLLTKFQQQPLVQEIVETFGGHIIEKTVKPSN